ncbi:MAG: hypothetical protein HYY15_03610 [Candidatus Omnitrophica bacterium]|nr:hypothetical protein [Candidatus Omnitrophota bacterium]
MRTLRHVIALAVVGSCLGLSGASSGEAAESAQSPTPPAPTQTRTVICPICHRVNQADVPYPEKAGLLLVRGASNTAFGWTELILQPAAEVKAGGNLATGVGKGVVAAMTRTGRGLGELLTFWTPKQSKNPPPPLATDCPICMGQQ